jgi:hypothetical protein
MLRKKRKTQLRMNRSHQRRTAKRRKITQIRKHLIKKKREMATNRLRKIATISKRMPKRKAPKKIRRKSKRTIKS